jgi:hypothetical protein
VSTAPRTSLERHLTEMHLKGCTCPHEWKGLGILYEISMGNGWVRMTDAEDCPIHGGKR